MTQVGDILRRVGALPPLPDTALKLMQVINDPQSTVEDIVEAIRYDQAVTGELLRLCNSAHFGLSRKVTSLNDAMLFLGTAKVLQLVMSVHTSGLLSKEQIGYGLEPGMLWKHSVGVALACSHLSVRLKLSDTGLVFTAGLLHDVGKVVLNEYVADEFAEIVHLVTEDDLSFLEAEHQVLGFSHEEIGGKIAESWQLPETIIQCIRHHHGPSTLDPIDPLVDTVYVADSICLMCGIGLGQDGLSYRADPTVTKRLDLVERDLEVIGSEVLTDLENVEQMFADGSKAGLQEQPVSR